MTKTSLLRRLEKLEEATGVVFDYERAAKDWREFYEHIMPVGANWDLDKMGRLAADQGVTVGDMIAKAMNNTRPLPSLQDNRA